MRTFLKISSAALSAALLMTSPVMAAGKADRARAAIAEANGKVDAAAKVATGGEAGRMQSEAAALARQAQQNLASGHKEQAFEPPNRMPRRPPPPRSRMPLQQMRAPMLRSNPPQQRPPMPPPHALHRRW